MSPLVQHLQFLLRHVPDGVAPLLPLCCCDAGQGGRYHLRHGLCHQFSLHPAVSAGATSCCTAAAAAAACCCATCCKLATGFWLAWPAAWPVFCAHEYSTAACNPDVPCRLAGKGTLVVSDALNHSSIVAGVRGSGEQGSGARTRTAVVATAAERHHNTCLVGGEPHTALPTSCPTAFCISSGVFFHSPFHTGAKVKVFDHNDPAHLEAVLRSAIAEGQPRTGRPWKKIVSCCCCCG